MRRMVSSGTASSRPIPTIAGAMRGETMMSPPSSPNCRSLNSMRGTRSADSLSVGEAHLACRVGEHGLPFRRHAVLDAAVLQLVAIDRMGQGPAFPALARDAQAHQHALGRRLSVRGRRCAPLFTWQWAQRSSLNVGPSPHTPEGSGATTQASLNCSLPLAKASTCSRSSIAMGMEKAADPDSGVVKTPAERAEGSSASLPAAATSPIAQPAGDDTCQQPSAAATGSGGHIDDATHLALLAPPPYPNPLPHAGEGARGSGHAFRSRHTQTHARPEQDRRAVQCRSHGLCLTPSGSQMVS